MCEFGLDNIETFFRKMRQDKNKCFDFERQIIGCSVLIHRLMSVFLYRNNPAIHHHHNFHKQHSFEQVLHQVDH